MRLDLTGRTALVTGSTQGIGQAIAAGLAAAGARVGVNGRSAGSVERAIAEMTGEFVAVPADVATEEGAAAVREMLPDADILINNLGIFGAKARSRSPSTASSPGRRTPRAWKVSCTSWSTRTCRGHRRSASSCASTARNRCSSG